MDTRESGLGGKCAVVQIHDSCTQLDVADTFEGYISSFGGFRTKATHGLQGAPQWRATENFILMLPGVLTKYQDLASIRKKATTTTSKKLHHCYFKTACSYTRCRPTGSLRLPSKYYFPN